jgi:hypothetical protein
LIGKRNEPHLCEIELKGALQQGDKSPAQQANGSSKGEKLMGAGSLHVLDPPSAEGRRCAHLFPDRNRIFT